MTPATDKLRGAFRASKDNLEIAPCPARYVNGKPLYEIRFHKSACVNGSIIPRHLPDTYDNTKRKFDTIAPGNKIFCYIAKL